MLAQHFETASIGGGGAFNTETGEGSGAGAEAMVERFCNHLGLPYNVQRAAYNIAVKQRDIGVLAGRSPISVAAACIYFTCCLYDTVKPASEIAKVTGVSEVTLRLAYKCVSSFSYPRHCSRPLQDPVPISRKGRRRGSNQVGRRQARTPSFDIDGSDALWLCDAMQPMY